MPMPRVFIIDDPSPNAFATGNNPQHAAVAATTGLLAIMNREELEGVMAHEMTHVRNYDIRLQTIALALTAAISLLVNFAGNFMWFGASSRRDDREGRGRWRLCHHRFNPLDHLGAPSSYNGPDGPVAAAEYPGRCRARWS